MSNKIPVYEMFEAFQGEGVHMGKAFFFIRTFGCPVKCDFCDSAGTWHPDYIPKHIERFTVEELVKQTQASSIPRVIVTGGEPTIHDLTDLCHALRSKRISVHLETSGAFPIKGNFDWITLSPKWAKLPLTDNVFRASEFKLIIEHPEDIEKWTKQLEEIAKGISLEHYVVWLHPEWSQRNNPEILKAISQAVLKFPTLYRAGYQIHRLYNVDALDKRSKPSVPLGGNPEKGI